MENNKLTDEEIEKEFLNRKSFREKLEKIGAAPKTAGKQSVTKSVEKITAEKNQIVPEEKSKEISDILPISEKIPPKEEKPPVLIEKQEKKQEVNKEKETLPNKPESEKVPDLHKTTPVQPLADRSPDSHVGNFPKDFLWGVSTSAYQVEGGDHNDWSVWEKSEKRKKFLRKKKKNISDYICGNACDSYSRYKEDLDLVKNLNCNAYRFGLEWSKIEPKKGTWNISAIKHYKEQLKEAKQRGLKTIVTIWHWTNPVWVAEEKGWQNPKIVKYFGEYAKMVIKELDIYVDFWVTLNEPTIPLVNGYLTRRFPPNKRSLIGLYKAMNNLAKAHNYTYELIHKYYKTPTSVVTIANYYEPAHKWNPLEVLIAKLAKYFGTTMFLNKIKGNFDFIAFDYYFHDRFVWYPPFKKNKMEKVTDMGWEIYPEGIYHVLKELAEYKKPIIICENGIADAEDKYRADFIRDHVRYVHKAISEGVDVRGYFYWSLLDNFEWDSGWNQKFGLYKVDRKTFERTERPSAQVYRDIIKYNS